MASSLYQDEDNLAAISDINVTPLVDVVLVLLIIFMVTAKLIVSRGISVDSPKTASGDEVKSTLQVTIDKKRQLYVNGDPYSDIAAAQARVESLRQGNPELKAIITADTTVPHGDVMQVIDFVKLAGVTRFALTSDPLARARKDGQGSGQSTGQGASPGDNSGADGDSPAGASPAGQAGTPVRAGDGTE